MTSVVDDRSAVAQSKIMRNSPPAENHGESAGPRGAKFAPTFLPDQEVELAAAEARARVFAELHRLQLDQNVFDLETNGYTVLTPGQHGADRIIPMLRERVVEIAGRRSGFPIDVTSGETLSTLRSPFGQAQWEPALLLEDPIFEQVLMNGPALALVTYLLGESCRLSHLSSVVKGPGDEYLPLHADQNQTSSIAPFPAYAQVANATWALTDYTQNDGAICFVPGSHRYCRAPSFAEATDLRLFRPLEVPAGSIIVWHGNTWHGALPRRNAGIRVSLIGYFCRWYHPSAENLGTRLSAEALKRNAVRFAVLCGAHDPMTEINSLVSRAARVSPFV